MKRLIPIVLAVALVLALGTGLAVANTTDSGHPSAKATAKVGDINVLSTENTTWTPILTQTIKTANQKDLFIDVSLECGLYTRTLVKSKNLQSDTSTAIAGIAVQVWVDSTQAYPGEVIFAKRAQTLTAKLAGMIVDLNVTEEEIELILDTMEASSFNFVLDDLGPGVHTVTVEAMIEVTEEFQTGAAEAYATIGMGSVTIEEVRMIQNEDIEL